MSLDAKLLWEEHSRAAGTPFIVGKELAIWARDGHLSSPSNAQLASACRLSLRQVQRAIRALEQAGEIERQAGRARAFLICPDRPRQQLLFDVVGDVTTAAEPELELAAGGDMSPCERRSGGDTAMTPRGDTHAGAWSEDFDGLTSKAPPQPPQQVGGARIDPGAGGLVLTAPRSVAPKLSHRRRRRREVPTYASEPCRDRTAAAWLSAVRERLGDPTFEIWLADAHLHGAVLAVEPDKVGWVADRFGRLLAAAAGSDVQLVGCLGVAR